MAKKILILSSVYGHGHIATAKAVESALLAIDEALEVDIIDFGEVLGSDFNKTTKKTYDNWSKYSPIFYQIFFEATDRPSVVKALNKIGYRINKQRLETFFKSKEADLILINAPGWVYTASLVSKNIISGAPVVTLVTDTISLHTSWTIGNVDQYLVPNEDSAAVLHSMGVAHSKLHSFGYPVDQRIFDPGFESIKFMHKHGINSGQKNFLYLPASDSSLTAQRQIRRLNRLYPDWGIVVVCGRNQALYKSLKKSSGQYKSHVFGWTDEWPYFIRSSDIVITKAGGSTVMECISAGKPQIITKIIPGQEEGNALYVQKNQLGEICLNGKYLGDSIAKIITDYDGYTTRCKSVTNPDVNQQIADFLLSLM